MLFYLVLSVAIFFCVPLFNYIVGTIDQARETHLRETVKRAVDLALGEREADGRLQAP